MDSSEAGIDGLEACRALVLLYENSVLMANGRCLRPALHSSLRSLPSHPTGVSALRETIAIAKERKEKKQREGGLFKSGFEIAAHGGKTVVAESGARCNDLEGRCHKGELR